VQPRFLETLHCWGLATEVHEEGPLIERTAIYKDGKKLLFRPSHQSDSRYRGLHIITQGQIERIYVRDLLRHKQLVERQTVISDFRVDNESLDNYPVKVALKNERTGLQEDVEAKFLVGADGAGSFVRKKLQIPFDGVSTDIYWGIMDAVFESDYPHAWAFGCVLPSLSAAALL
jgi:phenol 2-monooxygenase